MLKALKALLVILTFYCSTLSYANFEGTIVGVYSSNVVTIKKTDGQLVRVRLMDVESILDSFKESNLKQVMPILKDIENDAIQCLNFFIHHQVIVKHDTHIGSNCYTGLVIDKKHNKPIGIALIVAGFGETFPPVWIKAQRKAAQRAIISRRGIFSASSNQDESLKELSQQYEDALKP